MRLYYGDPTQEDDDDDEEAEWFDEDDEDEESYEYDDDEEDDDEEEGDDFDDDEGTLHFRHHCGTRTRCSRRYRTRGIDRALLSGHIPRTYRR